MDLRYRICETRKYHFTKFNDSALEYLERYKISLRTIGTFITKILKPDTQNVQGQADSLVIHIISMPRYPRQIGQSVIMLYIIVLRNKPIPDFLKESNVDVWIWQRLYSSQS